MVLPMLASSEKCDGSQTSFEMLDRFSKGFFEINPEVWPVYARRFERTFGFAPA